MGQTSLMRPTSGRSRARAPRAQIAAPTRISRTGAVCKREEHASHLLYRGIPIVNENDTVATEEIRREGGGGGANDHLATL